MESTVLDPARKASKKCQIEGCHEITVGSRTALCRKHRNNKYKQNYNKKKKRKAHSPDEMPSESIENQLAEEKCLMEQKYASMLQQVLAQKRLELLQSENIIQVLQAHQQKVKQCKIKEIQERKLKKEQEAPENTDQGSVSSKITSDISSHSTKDRNSDKSNFKATKTAKKTQQQSKKGPAKSAVPKDMQIGNNHVTFSGNMGVTQKPLLPSSDLATKTLYAGVSITPSVWTNSDSYIGQNLLVPKGPAQQATPMRPLAMSTQPIPKTDSVFSYQQSTLSGVGQSGGYAKICIESVKDLSLGPSGKIATSVVTSAAPNSKALHNVQTRLPQNVQPYQMIQKGILPSENITSQGECNRQSFQSLTTSCTSAPVTTGGNIVTAMAVGQQSQISLPLLNFSQAMSLSNGQITTSGTYTQVSQTNQGTMSQNWPNQMIPGTGTGRLQAPGIQDDFLLQMLQDSKNSQLELVPQSQTNSTMTSLDHVLTDQTWTLSVGM